MKLFKIGFLAIVAVVAMSFTMISSPDAKRVTITNCYLDQQLQWINQTNCATTTLACLTKADAISKYVRQNTFTLGTFDQTEECNGTVRICCVSFENAGSTPVPSCDGTVPALKSTALNPIIDFQGNLIPVGNYVKVHQVECKPQ